MTVMDKARIKTAERIRQRIEVLRMPNGSWTLELLAHECGVSLATMSRWASGTIPLRPQGEAALDILRRLKINRHA